MQRGRYMALVPLSVVSHVDDDGIGRSLRCGERWDRQLVDRLIRPGLRERGGAEVAGDAIEANQPERPAQLTKPGGRGVIGNDIEV